MKNDNVRFLTACMGPTDTPMLLNFAQDDIADWAKDEQENLLDVLKIKQKCVLCCLASLATSLRG